MRRGGVRGSGHARSEQEHQVPGAKKGWSVARLRDEDDQRRPRCALVRIIRVISCFSQLLLLFA